MKSLLNSEIYTFARLFFMQEDWNDKTGVFSLMEDKLFKKSIWLSFGKNNNFITFFLSKNSCGLCMKSEKENKNFDKWMNVDAYSVDLRDVDLWDLIWHLTKY